MTHTTDPPPRRRLRISRRRFLQACAGALVAGSGTLGYARTVGASNLQVEQVTIGIPHLAKRWHGCRLAHLSDLHHGHTNLTLITHALNIARDLKPDFLLLTGDIVDNKFADLAALTRVLTPITSHVETLGCTGNHD